MYKRGKNAGLVNEKKQKKILKKQIKTKENLPMKRRKKHQHTSKLKGTKTEGLNNATGNIRRREVGNC